MKPLKDILNKSLLNESLLNESLLDDEDELFDRNDETLVKMQKYDILTELSSYHRAGRRTNEWLVRRADSGINITCNSNTKTLIMEFDNRVNDLCLEINRFLKYFKNKFGITIENIITNLKSALYIVGSPGNNVCTGVNITSQGDIVFDDLSEVRNVEFTYNGARTWHKIYCTGNLRNNTIFKNFTYNPGSAKTTKLVIPDISDNPHQCFNSPINNVRFLDIRDGDIQMSNEFGWHGIAALLKDVWKQNEDKNIEFKDTKILTSDNRYTIIKPNNVKKFLTLLKNRRRYIMCDKEMNIFKYNIRKKLNMPDLQALEVHGFWGSHDLWIDVQDNNTIIIQAYEK